MHGSLGLPASQCLRPALVASRSRSIWGLRWLRIALIKASPRASTAGVQVRFARSRHFRGRESFCVVVRHGDVASDEFSRALPPRDDGAAARVELPSAHRDRDAVAVLEPRARDGFERPRRRPPRGHDAEDATRVGGREGREAEPGSFHYFYNVMPSIDEIFGSL